MTEVTPGQITTAGGHVDVYGTALPPNPVVQVGSSYEPVDSDLSGTGYIDVAVGTLAPGTYPLVVSNASGTAQDQVPNAIQVVSDTTTPGGGTGSTGSGATGSSATGSSGTGSTGTGPVSGGTGSGGAGSPGTGSGSTGPSGSAPVGGGSTGSGTGTGGTGSAGSGSPGTGSGSSGGSGTGTGPVNTGPGPVFTAPDGLQLSLMASGSDLSAISTGAWGIFTCHAGTCAGVNIG